MNNLNTYFERYSNKISFLTVKKIDLNNKTYEYIDFPINSKVLTDNIKSSNFKENISTEFFSEGILLLISINSNFKNINILKKFLFYWNDNLVDFVRKKLILNKNNREDIVYNILLLRSLILLNETDYFICNLYIKYLIIFLDYVEADFNSIFMNEIKLKLSEQFKKNEHNSIVNLLYGDLNAKEKFYIKSDLFYKKALNLSNDNNIISIIEEKIKNIDIKVKIEKLLQLIEKYNFKDSYDILNDITKKIKILDKEDCYWIAYSYNKLDEKKLSIKYYEKSLELNADFLNIFIELGLLYYQVDRIEKSLEIFKKGLKIYIDDEILLFNKIILELKLKNYKNAKKDIDKILLYEDLDNSILNDILYLKNLYENYFD